jgi:hypothetical protein
MHALLLDLAEPVADVGLADTLAPLIGGANAEEI